MKAESTIKKEIRALRKFINDPDSDHVATRIAWSVEQALRWATEDVKGWPNRVEDAKGTAELIKNEYA
jgi:hypothetical protein